MKKTRLKKLADRIEQVQAQIQIEYNGQPGDGQHKISAIFKGEEVGSLTFTEKENNVISIDDGKVDPYFEDCEIEEMILDQFGYIMEGDYPGFGVEPHFNSPEFENAYRTLVSQGLIPATAFDNSKVTRNYDEESQTRFEDYKNNWPDSVQARRKLNRLRKYS